MGNGDGFARKEVRQFAKWLERRGWVRDGEDTNGHAYYVWPANGARLSLPSTPRGGRWKRTLRTQACKAMGLPAHQGKPNHRHSKQRPTTSGFNLQAAVKDQRRSNDGNIADAVEDLWVTRDALIDTIAGLAEHPTYRTADDGKKAIERIRAIEADLRAYGARFTPFTESDLTDRREP